MKYIAIAMSKLCHLWGIVLGVGALAVIPTIKAPLWVVLGMTVMSIILLAAEQGLNTMVINAWVIEIHDIIKQMIDDETDEEDKQ